MSNTKHARKEIRKEIECLTKLRELKENKDCEAAHIKADNALCEFLTFLGYTEITKAFDDICKWYS